MKKKNIMFIVVGCFMVVVGMLGVARADSIYDVDEVRILLANANSDVTTCYGNFSFDNSTDQNQNIFAVGTYKSLVDGSIDISDVNAIIFPDDNGDLTMEFYGTNGGPQRPVSKLSIVKDNGDGRFFRLNTETGVVTIGVAEHDQSEDDVIYTSEIASFMYGDFGDLGELGFDTEVDTKDVSPIVMDTSLASDIDEDGVPDVEDNCPAVANENQHDVDGDRTGDACDSDTISGVVTGVVDPEDVTIKVQVSSCGAEETVDVPLRADGSYSIGNLDNDTYGIVPVSVKHTFDPGFRGLLQIPQAEIQSYDFVATQTHFSISGITTGVYVGGVTLSLYKQWCGSRELVKTIMTASNVADYSFLVDSDGYYIVVPMVGGPIAFSPEEASVTVNGADVTVEDLEAFIK